MLGEAEIPTPLNRAVAAGLGGGDSVARAIAAGTSRRAKCAWSRIRGTLLPDPRAATPGPAASPASVSVMTSSNRKYAEHSSVTPAQSSEAQPRALRDERREPLPSCPRKCAT